MEHFVRVILEKSQNPSKLDESVFPKQHLLETTEGNPVIELPLDAELTEAQSDEFAGKLSDYLIDNGYHTFDIEISTSEEM